MSIQFGVVGLGLIADFHARAIRAMSGGRGTLAACCSRQKEKSHAFAEKHGCAAYTSLEDFLRHPGLQVVTICTPSGAHRDAALAAAAAGKHLLVEKPLEITTPRCRAIIDACRSRGVTLAGIFPSRFHEAARVVKDAIDPGRLGRITLGSAYVKWFRSQEYYDRGGWHGTRRWDGGGALMNQAIHAIDLLQWFMGPVESVQAFTATLGHERIEVEDNAAAVLRFSNGALGAIEGSTCVFPGFLKRIEVSGTLGSIVLEEESLTLWELADALPEDAEIRRRLFARSSTGGGAADPAAIGIEGHRRQFEDFADALEAGRKPSVDGEEALKAIRIIEAIYRSAEKSRPVPVR